MLWLHRLFALPGIGLLIIFILARPQEFFPLLQRVPFLHLFTAFAVIGYVIDIRLRRLQPIAANTLPWIVAFLLWAMVVDCGQRCRTSLLPRASRDGDLVRAVRNDRARRAALPDVSARRRRARGDVRLHRGGVLPSRTRGRAMCRRHRGRRGRDRRRGGWAVVRRSTSSVAGPRGRAGCRVSLRARRAVRHVQRRRPRPLSRRAPRSERGRPHDLRRRARAADRASRCASAVRSGGDRRLAAR